MEQYTLALRIHEDYGLSDINLLDLETIITELLEAGATLGLSDGCRDLAYETQTYGTILIAEFERITNLEDSIRDKELNKLLTIITEATNQRWNALFNNTTTHYEERRRITQYYAKLFGITALETLKDDPTLNYLKVQYMNFDKLFSPNKMQMKINNISNGIQIFNTIYSTQREMTKRHIMVGRHLLTCHKLIQPVLCLKGLKQYLVTSKDGEQNDITNTLITRDEVSKIIKHLGKWTDIGRRMSIQFKHSKGCKLWSRETEVTTEHEQRNVSIRGCSDTYTRVTPIITRPNTCRFTGERYKTWNITINDRYCETAKIDLTVGKDQIIPKYTWTSELKESERCIEVLMNVRCTLELRQERRNETTLTETLKLEMKRVGDEILLKLANHLGEMLANEEMAKLFTTTKELLRYTRLCTKIAEVIEANRETINNQEAISEMGDEDEE